MLAQPDAIVPSAASAVVTLAWDDASSLDNPVLLYIVYEKIGSTYQPVGSVPAPLTTAVLPDVSLGAHTYVVTASNFLSESAYSNECTVSVDATGGKPETGFSAWLAASAQLGEGWWYLAFAETSSVFGYYNTGPASAPWPSMIYHADLGFLFRVDAGDDAAGIYFYDFASQTWFYTSPKFPFPYLYDFSLNAMLYYYADSENPGRYTRNPRYFFNFTTGQIISK